MTQPPGGYPPPDPGEQHPPPADPFYAPPSWEPPTAPNPPGPPAQPTQAIPSGPPAQPTQAIPSGPLAQPTQPIPPYPPPSSGSPYSAPPGGPSYGQPTSPYQPPGSAPPYSYPGGGPPPARRRRGPLIVAIVAAVALLVLGGGGLAAWLLTRDPDRNGATSPTVAVQSFLQAVYHDQDPAGAADMVCSEARDEGALETKINEIRSYQETQVNPTFSWTEPAVVDETQELAVVEVTVTMVTGDERVADQSLRVSVLDKDANGWWVCDLQTVETAAEPPADEGSQSTPNPTPPEGE